jgi:hypothetical protein
MATVPSTPTPPHPATRLLGIRLGLQTPLEHKTTLLVVILFMLILLAQITKQWVKML